MQFITILLYPTILVKVSFMNIPKAFSMELFSLYKIE